MLSTVVDDVVEKLIHDGEFRKEFEHDREGVLRRYALTKDQRNALLVIDPAALAEAATSIAGCGAARYV